MAIDSEAAFNIICSPGTTGEPKGIVQSRAMRRADAARAARYGYGADTVTLLSNPLYSNTTLVVFFPTLAFGGSVVHRSWPMSPSSACPGANSRQWGETPVALVVRRAGQGAPDDAALLQWANARLGKTQDLHSLRSIDALPRSPIGKVLKRDLRERHGPV